MAIEVGRPNVRGIAEIPKQSGDDFYTFSDLMKGPKPKLEWLVRDLVTTRGINHITGAITSGKSVIAMQLIKSVREGLDFLGFKPEKTGPIVYFGLEDGKTRMYERTRKQNWKVDGNLPEVHFCHELNLGMLPGINILKEAVEKYEPVLVVIDPLMLSTGTKDINSNKDMSEFARNLREILVKHEFAFFIVHHDRKTYDKFPDMGEIETGLGATANLALSDTRMRFFGKEGEKKIRIFGKDVKNPGETFSVKKDSENYLRVRKRPYNKGGGK